MRLSVVIPVYNRASLIGQTIRSILSQTLTADEIIVVDDGSTDGTSEVVYREYSSFYETIPGRMDVPILKIISQRNQGPAAARNRGFQVSSGEFIHFFDSDDVAAINKHYVQFNALTVSNADIAIGPWLQASIAPSMETCQVNIHANSSMTAYKYYTSWFDCVLQRSGLPSYSMTQALLCDWALVPHACLFRRTIIDKVGGFRESHFGTEDTIFLLEALFHGASVVHTPQTIELYRLGNEKITSAEHRLRHLHEWAKAIVVMRTISLAHNVDPKLYFLFRLRAWRCLNDLLLAGFNDHNLFSSLEEIILGTPSSVYKTFMYFSRYNQILRRLLSGKRFPACFQSGPLSEEHIRLLETSGYVLG